MSHAISISPQQRDLLYDRILVHLSGIDDVWMAASTEDFETADRLAHEFCDGLHLITEDLGWGEHGDSEPVVLTAPPDILRRVLERLRLTVASEGADELEERNELRDLAEVNREIRETCDQVLTELGELEASG